jgi:hypothetical protein
MNQRHLSIIHLLLLRNPNQSRLRHQRLLNSMALSIHLIQVRIRDSNFQLYDRLSLEKKLDFFKGRKRAA